MEQDFLDEHFAAPEAVEAEAAPEPTATPVEATDGPLRGPDGKFLPKQTTGVDDTVPPTDKLPQEDYKAIREEREKRQRAEARLEALEKQFQSFQTPQEPPPPPPTIWDDEQGALQHNQQQAVSQATFMARLDTSEMLASQAHEDFDAMKDKFIEMMRLNPAIQQEALAAKHPWEKAYQIAKNAATAAELGATNVAELEAKIEARVREQLAAEQVATPQAVPLSLADAQSSRRVGNAPVGPLTLEQILGR